MKSTITILSLSTLFIIPLDKWRWRGLACQSVSPLRPHFFFPLSIGPEWETVSGQHEPTESVWDVLCISDCSVSISKPDYFAWFYLKWAKTFGKTFYQNKKVLLLGCPHFQIEVTFHQVESSTLFSTLFKVQILGKYHKYHKDIFELAHTDISLKIWQKEMVRMWRVTTRATSTHGDTKVGCDVIVN